MPSDLLILRLQTMAQAGGMGSAGPVTAEAGLDEVPLCVYVFATVSLSAIGFHALLLWTSYYDHYFERCLCLTSIF